MPRHEMEYWQSLNLCKTIRRVYDRVPLIRQRMDELKVKPEDIKHIKDIVKLPFTTKLDLRDTYPYGLFACDMSEIVRLHASSGTTGKQIVVGYTKKDIDIWAECAARALVSVGGSKDDIVHVSYGYGLFTGGLGLHYGAELLGAVTLPASSGNTNRQVTMIKDFGSTILCCTPSYALYIGDTLEQMGVNLSEIKLKSGLFGAEPWTENMRSEIEKRLGIKAYDIYGLSEISGPGVSFDCECQSGMHINEDHFYPEIIDPVTCEPLPDGRQGELVFTSITKEAFPLIRYRTRDITSLSHEKCSCGRTLVKMSRLRGRTDDMLIIRGVNVFPSQIESVLLSLGQGAPHYQMIVERVNNLDTLEVQVEMSDELFSDQVKKLDAIEENISNAIYSTLGLSAKVRLVEPRTIARSEGKAKRVIDNRNLK
ncbi:MAG: phenylacetate--CoA ligase [Oscillospiraceae bacterium]|nr:phenylacetate--CoA ligase [Oscillospiraceae bacterium]